MACIEITGENFEQIINDNPIVFLDFWATWCGPCKSFGPVFEAAAEANPDIVFGKIDTDAQQELASVFGIRSVPTLAVIRERIMVFRESGAIPANALQHIVDGARNLDMEEVRAEIAAQQAGQQQD